MKVLVTAASKHGATGEIAQAIGNRLTEYGFDTKVLPPGAVGTIEAYDAIVLGSAVYAGHWLEPARSWRDDGVMPSSAGRCGSSQAARLAIPRGRWSRRWVKSPS